MWGLFVRRYDCGGFSLHPVKSPCLWSKMDCSDDGEATDRKAFSCAQFHWKLNPYHMLFMNSGPSRA